MRGGGGFPEGITREHYYGSFPESITTGSGVIVSQKIFEIGSP
jgi:hypothetical protein